MSKRMFEFTCSEGHYFETLVDESVRTLECKVCGSPSERLISTPRLGLDPISGDFIGATDKWARQRAEKLKQAQSKSYYEGN